uniref:Uncharacterized protein n=1 Tax=Knipowitschia caucasica TaxID=637954 RepID=A0AAV2LR71_KNICA
MPPLANFLLTSSHGSPPLMPRERGNLIRVAQPWKLASGGRICRRTHGGLHCDMIDLDCHCAQLDALSVATEKDYIVSQLSTDPLSKTTHVMSLFRPTSKPSGTNDITGGVCAEGGGA